MTGAGRSSRARSATTAVGTHLEDTYRDVFDGATTPRRFVHVDGTSYSYWCRPDAAAVTAVESRIRASGRPGRLAALGLRTTARVPVLARLLPRFDLVAIDLPETGRLDAAIVGWRTKTFHLSDGLVYTFPNDRSGDLLGACRIRQGLPAEINVPEIVEIDEDYPYFVEAYVAGETIRDPVEQRDLVFQALEELGPLYDGQSPEWVSTESLLADVRSELQARDAVEDSLVSAAFDALADLQVPEQLGIGRIHGDLHPDNVVVSGDEVYLLDWESSRTDLIVADFFKPFEIGYAVDGDDRAFEGMIRGTGVGDELATRYARTFGPLAFDGTDFPSGLPLVYLLRRVTDPDPETVHDHWCYRLLASLVRS